MKEFIKENWWWLIFAFGFLGVFILALSTQERREVGGVVYEHNVTADKYGSRTYSTIVKTDDGFIEEEIGLDLYAIPVGSRVTIEVIRAKHKK